MSDMSDLDSAVVAGMLKAKEIGVKMLASDCEAILQSAIASMQGEAVAMHLACPACHAEHIDEGEWATRKHKTHQCQKCGHEWRPFEFATVGVPSPATAEIARLQKELEEARKDAKRLHIVLAGHGAHGFAVSQKVSGNYGILSGSEAVQAIDASLNIKGGAE